MLACREEANRVAPSGPPTLKVSLPTGYSATPTASGLDIVREGQAIGTLEVKSALKNAASTLEETLEKSGGRSLTKRSSGPFLGLTYVVSGDAGTRRAFIGLKSGTSLPVGCASTSAALEADLEPLADICESVELVSH